MEDEDIDCCKELLPKALDIYEDISGYDPKDEPSNGFEYLHKVMIENKATPKTAVANICIDEFKKNQTVYIEENPPDEVDKSLIPSIGWQIEQVNSFNNLRCSLNQQKIEWEDKKEIISSNLSIPEDLNDPATWMELFTNREPLVSTMFSLNNVDLANMLNYITNCLEDETLKFTSHLIRWIFSIFACLQEPLEPSTCSDIRTIIKIAKKTRAKIENDDDLLMPLNLIICIAARCYRQSDLIDN